MLLLFRSCEIRCCCSSRETRAPCPDRKHASPRGRRPLPPNPREGRPEAVKHRVFIAREHTAGYLLPTTQLTYLFRLDASFQESNQMAMSSLIGVPQFSWHKRQCGSASYPPLHSLSLCLGLFLSVRPSLGFDAQGVGEKRHGCPLPYARRGEGARHQKTGKKA